MQAVQMSKPIKGTWKSTTAGILEIIDGSFSALISVTMIIGAAVIGSGAAWLGLNASDFDGMALSVVATILLVVALVVLAFAVLEILGGISAVQRKRWGLALAGGIASAIPFNLIGIFAIILLALSKDEFV